MIVGNTLNNITANYFVIDGVPLFLECTKKAVAVAFYSYHALYTSYPAQSIRLWVVLEKALFGFNDPTDKASAAALRHPEVRRLIKALEV